jgi:hypothetical protein
MKQAQKESFYGRGCTGKLRAAGATGEARVPGRHFVYGRKRERFSPLPDKSAADVPAAAFSG